MVNFVRKTMKIPCVCSHASYLFFRKQVRNVETEEAVVNAGLAIALNVFDDLDCREVLGDLDELANKISSRVKGKSAEARIAHLHQVLFFEEGYISHVNRQASHLLDLFLPTVLKLKVGSSEIIGLIYQTIASKIGLEVEAVVCDDRIFIRLHDGHGWLVVDLFKQAATNDKATIQKCLQQPVLKNSEWIRRMLTRKIHVLKRDGHNEDHAAMCELLLVLDEKDSI